MATYFNSRNETVHLGGKLGGGGEGNVYSIAGNAEQVAKIWVTANLSGAATHNADEMSEKIKIMMQNPPAIPNRNGGLFSRLHNPLAWPEGALYGADGNVAGYLMPRIDLTVFRDIFYYYVPRELRDLEQQRGTAFNRQDFLLIARNLSESFDCLHQSGYVIGDVNERNALVNDQRQVVIIDCDSMQVKDPATDKTYLCTVGRPDYTPPGLTPGTERTSNDDCFGLAVIVFKLLMEGDHPYKISHTKTETKDKIRLGQFPYRHPGNRRRITDAVSRYQGRWEKMEPNLRRCFRDAFAPDYRSQRPSAAEWVDELDCVINPRATGIPRSMERRIQDMDRQLQSAVREREDAVEQLENERQARNQAGQTLQELNGQLADERRERVDVEQQLKLEQVARSSAEAQLADAQRERSRAEQSLQERDKQLVDERRERADAEQQLKLEHDARANAEAQLEDAQRDLANSKPTRQDEKQFQTGSDQKPKTNKWTVVLRIFVTVASLAVIAFLVLLILFLQS